MPWQLFVAFRYFTAKRKERFISVINLMSMLGIAVGVGALIIVISVMSGFDEDLKSKIIGTYSHIEVISDQGITPSEEFTGRILSARDTIAVSFFLNGQALVKYGSNVTGVMVKGVVPQDEVKTKQVENYIKNGTFLIDSGEIVIGSELAKKTGARIGSKIDLVFPKSDRMPGAMDIITKNYAKELPFTVRGIFSSGMYEYDTSLVYINLEDAQSAMGLGNIASGAAVKIQNAFNADSVKDSIRRKLGPPYIVRTWSDSNRNFLEAIKLEKTVMFVILTLIVAVACFNIASSLIMTVTEKTKDIGILKAIGATNPAIMAVFAVQGAITGIVGTLAGAALGISACWCLGKYKFITLPSDIYYIDKLPVKISSGEIYTIVMTSVLISILAALYPALKASRLDPVEALRYE